jgi:hypothetical protein
MILPANASPVQIGTWEKLGSRKVNFKADRDEIVVTRRDGKFRKIKLEVEGGSVNFHECIVVFGDGKRQNVRMKKVIHEGQSTRVIDLQGGRRVIKKVIFVYDTHNYENKKAKVTLRGLH